MKYPAVFLLLMILSSCNILSGKQKSLLLNKRFDDGCEMIVEMTPSDSLNVLHVSLRLSENKYASIAGSAEMLKMQYGMDSAFYILQNRHKIYADAIQPILTVSKERFDYMVYYYGRNILDDGKASFHFKELAPFSGDYAIELTSN